MPKNRKAAEDEILKGLEMIYPGCPDIQSYKDRFSKMSDKAFEEFILRLKSGEETLQITVPPGTEGKSLNFERNMAVAEKWGKEFHQSLWMPAEDDEPSFKTPVKYLVLKLPVRIASQRVAKKASIPKTTRIINSLNGQPTGESKGASWSFPELRLSVAMGMKAAPTELMKYRGGDLRGNAALNASLIRTGHARLDVLKHFASGVVSTQTLSTYLTSAMLKNTLPQS